MVDSSTCIQCPYPDEVARLSGRVKILERKQMELEHNLLNRIELLAIQVGENGAHFMAAASKLTEMILRLDSDMKDGRREFLAAVRMIGSNEGREEGKGDRNF